MRLEEEYTTFDIIQSTRVYYIKYCICSEFPVFPIYFSLHFDYKLFGVKMLSEVCY